MPKKSHRKSRDYGRKVNTRNKVDRFLIVCEGKQTEVRYFKKFRVPFKVELVVKGTGKNTFQVVEEAIRLRTENEEAYDQVWCVFDKDNFPSDHFNNAITKAQHTGIKFELWFLLHFSYQHTAMNRKEYYKNLSRHLDCAYDTCADDMYEKLKQLQQTAITHAQNLMQQYEQTQPADADPSTTVHILVEQLLKHAR